MHLNQCSQLSQLLLFFLNHCFASVPPSLSLSISLSLLLSLLFFSPSLFLFFSPVSVCASSFEVAELAAAASKCGCDDERQIESLIAFSPDGFSRFVQENIECTRVFAHVQYLLHCCRFFCFVAVYCCQSAHSFSCLRDWPSVLRRY